jgi:ribosomal protein S18 acetylase RimI-like enzyme
MTIRVMTLADYPAVYALWASLPGIGLHEPEDSYEGMAYYLRRNPDTCFVAEDGGALIGAVLCGNDGRRGYINHLAVAAEHQGRGLGRSLVNACRAAMRSEGIPMCSFVTFRDNEAGNAFWDAIGSTRHETLLYRKLKTGELI